MELFANIMGWIGMALIAWAYFLISHHKVKQGSVYYQILNIAGALSMGVNVLYFRSWPALFLQIVWLLIAVTALFRKNKIL